MSVTTKQYSIWAASMVASLAAAFAAVGATQAGSENLRCEIAASSAHGMLTLEGRAQAREALAGSYSFEVEGTGTRIRQGGAFDAAAGAIAALGTVRLGGGGPYEARLTITANGGTVQCAQWSGPAL